MKSHATSPIPETTVRVLLPLPVGDGYDYLLPEGVTEIPFGSFVEVPFGKKTALGVIWAEGTGAIAREKLKAIKTLLPLPSLPPETLAFVDWVANYNVTAPGLILKMALGGKLRELKKGDKLSYPPPNPDHHHPCLTESQQKAATELRAKIKNAGFAVTLLDGVTGSGKTEVYSEAIAECLRSGRQALVLLPEIAMTAALIDRLAARFGVRPTEWHSELTEKQRRLNWHAITQGQARFVLGARSALFLPYPDLGLIVVDEEHEGAYKQEEGVIYHGRDMAVVRARIGKFQIVLASATPSLETFLNVQKEKYASVVLRERFGGAVMPQIKLVDLRQEKMSAQRFIAPALLQALTETIEAGQQAMLFLNRRGYAPLTLCRACGHRLQCPHCTSWLIEHKKTGRLHCHQCSYSLALPKKCPTCHAEDHFAACGPGVERILEEVNACLPTARAAIMASDTLAGPKAAEAFISQMANHSLDLLIGTQIMAKGYHFPRLTLVGVIDADLGLGGGDPRAAERTFHLLQQMAGRSGRAQEAGIVYVQTADPDHPVMRALLKGDRDAFMATEMKQRSAYHLPPFTRLASLTVSGAKADEVIKMARKIAQAAPQTDKIRVLGPAPAPFTVLRGKTRHRLLVRAPRTLDLPKLLKAWLDPLDIPRTLKIQIDIDPYSFL